MFKAVIANNPDEQAIRTEYLRQYPDKFEAIAFFSQIHSRSLRLGASLAEEEGRRQKAEGLD
jgi:hypothetical protein